MRWFNVSLLTAFQLLTGAPVFSVHASLTPDHARNLLSLPQVVQPLICRQDARAVTNCDSLRRAAKAASRHNSRVLPVAPNKCSVALARATLHPTSPYSDLSNKRNTKKGAHSFFETFGSGSVPPATSPLAASFFQKNIPNTFSNDRGEPGDKPDDPRADPAYS